ncbi:D-alanyl-D-alanine carboxypeptidase/D-alanyl-D-alanine endopeptidase [Azospirillum sp.]|uniref:D-alanyl-D-alanine carboxypeptidase/D-alanyl-D-alanine endopeptidase n=1 Tax=Azospirillum sp. TaxID=34012 RepID=UPI002D595380|nr:D-alanyl-D-alanine carboxypeptidase/D-alanyl-D-alanine-endopeptidase [Azospirillum sp.]HYD71307.1 D-alanyl-D-alanine carboxypeptidase/D-alanyl-D-alanine-endopeptidase [Azospirillum sp.]
MRALSSSLRCGAAALIAVLLLAVSACAAPLVPDDADALARHGFTADDVGYLLFDLEDGRALAARQADRPFVPASVAKVPAMLAALALLGPEHRFTTGLHATGAVRDGVLHGDLFLKGGGDPTLATGELIALADALAAQGIQRVAGRFAYDSTALPELPEIDAGQPWTAGYNTGVSALSLNFNRFQLAWRRPAAGGPVQAEAWSVSDRGRHRLASVAIEVAPDGTAPFTPLEGKEGERWRFAALPGVAERTWLPVTRPALAAATVFRAVAAERGIALPAPVARPVPAGALLLAAHDSAPLAAVAAGVLRYSNNLSAELVALAAARRVDPRVDTLAGAGAAVAAWVRTQRPDVDWTGFALANGSGLTTASRMTPRQTAAILRLGGPALFDLLPGDEESGPLPGVRAKSGTLAYAKGLAGTLRTALGRRLGFVFFAGDDARRRAMDAAMDRRVAEMPADARAWLTRARALQSDLLALWAGGY